MVHGRLYNELWPEAARDTRSSYFSDIGLLAYVVKSRAEPASNDRPAALLTRECGEMKIMRRGFLGANQGPVPRHWRHSSCVRDWTIAQYRNLGHMNLFPRQMKSLAT
jgi:hypothetical protein